ncbi:MAG TPA: UvrD-helicase domain-containing protein [Nanoarchaeota archaeon]|nr:UvrD-helicase domain-containing protein [Nanoarchaeota archaeon]
MAEIPEYKRDESNDYLFVLKGLNEIPFPVGKNLLVDFLYGELENSSIEKNKLFDFESFGSMSAITKERIFEIIDKLVTNKLIEVSNSVFNNFSKVLSIGKNGRAEIINPTFFSKSLSQKYWELETKISEEEMTSFVELEDFLKGFNLEQKKTIVSPKEKILCIAGAGSGKTSVLTKRIEFLNKMKRVKSDKILAITFTRKAKDEMNNRLQEFGVNAVVETFNSFSEKILLKYGGKIYGRKMKIATFQDKMFAVLRALDNLGISMEEAIQNHFIYGNKNKTIYQLQSMFVFDCFQVFEYLKIINSIADYIEKNYSDETLKSLKMIFGIVKYLDFHMATNGLRTYGDQVRNTIDFFKVYKKFIPIFDHVLVDEFQDVNSEQIEFLDLLNSKNLFCTGDPRQSIFGWRGSEIDHILKFKEKYPDSEIINLTKNYRSNNHVVKVMNDLAKKMEVSPLESTFENKKDLKICKFDNEIQEFNFVKSKILSSEIPREEIFVLSRTNRQIEELSKVLKAAEINHSVKEEGSNDSSIKKGEVTLATIHSIKGLEAELVFVIGCTLSNFPCKASDHPVIEKINVYNYDREEEELRLFYVAISRAKNHLYLTYSGKNHTYFINKEVKESFSFEEF